MNETGVVLSAILIELLDSHLYVLGAVILNLVKGVSHGNAPIYSVMVNLLSQDYMCY